MKLPASVTTMELMDCKTKGFKAVIVALTNLDVQIYRDKYLVNTFKSEDMVTGLRFGRFGREDNTLVMTTKGVESSHMQSYEVQCHPYDHYKIEVLIIFVDGLVI